MSLACYSTLVKDHNGVMEHLGDMTNRCDHTTRMKLVILSANN